MMKKVNLGLFLSVVLFYLLPWVKFGILGYGITFTGFDLIRFSLVSLFGGEYTYTMLGQEYTQQVESDPSGLLLLVLTLLPILLALIGTAFSFSNKEKAKTLIGILGLVAVVLVAITPNPFLSAEDRRQMEAMQGVLQNDTLIGYWLSLLAFVFVAALNFLKLRGIQVTALVSSLFESAKADGSTRAVLVEDPKEKRILLVRQLAEPLASEQTWQAITKLIQAGIGLIGLIVAGWIINVIPFTETELGETGIDIRDLLGLVLAGLMVALVVSRIKALNALLAYCGTKPLNRLNVSSQSVISGLFQNLSLAFAIIICWIIVGSQLGTLSLLLGSWILWISTIGFFAGLGFVGYRLYKLSEPLIGQFVKPKTATETDEPSQGHL